MKKIFLCAVGVISLQISAQFSNSLSSNGMGLPQDNSILNKVRDNGLEKSLSYDDISGSPYFDKAFTPAVMAENYESAPARYNSYDDRIEYKKDDKLFFLPLEDKFSRVKFLYKNETFVYLNTDDDNKGYFLEVVQGNNSLYKKIKTKFVETVIATNSYATNKPAHFRTMEPYYYIKTENGFIKQPKNQKDFLQQYKGDQSKLNDFFKSNKIKFNKEEDLIKLVKFLNN